MYRFLAVRAFECRMITQMTLWKYMSHLFINDIMDTETKASFPCIQLDLDVCSTQLKGED